jgi:hypothetical protein
MNKTVCEVIYKTYGPKNVVVGVVFCHQNFMGKDADWYRKQLHDTVYDKFYEEKFQIMQLRARSDALCSEYESLTDDRTFWQKLTKNKNTPNWKRKEEINIELHDVEEKLFPLSIDFDGRRNLLVRKTHDFLKDNGFLINSHSVDDETHYEIWTREV